MSAQVYLHHYPASLFSEKIRLLLGYLGVPWHSVETSSIMPRPLLMPLTGGYRKTPNLQIGANVYSDTAVITTGLIRLTGDTTLYAPGFAAHRVAQWADSTLFQVTVAMNFRPEAIGAAMSRLSAEEVAAFQADRAQLSEGAPIVGIPPDAALTSFQAYLAQLEHSLDTPFLFGAAPCIADFSLYHCLWFVAQNAANAACLEPWGRVREWMARMQAFGHGPVTDSTGESALEHARACEPVLPEIEPLALEGIETGTDVTIAATDYGRNPIAGRLMAVSSEEIIIARSSPETGALLNHFPTVGFLISRA
ncbi:MAG: glutathione S-transferase family protein [Pseudomonadales bacterium]